MKHQKKPKRNHEIKLRAFGATNIVGPKWCGKTETALQKAKSNDLIFIRNDYRPFGTI